MAGAYRCVVTGRNRDGQSVVVRDEQVETGHLGIRGFLENDQMPGLVNG